jgi:molybdate transport system substrate-binding protein
MGFAELPWSKDGTGKVFDVPGYLDIEDLHGDITGPQLVIFFHGNQFMATDSLMKRFKDEYPQYRLVFWETLPPGVLVEQIKHGTLVVGQLRINLRPDIMTAGENLILELNREFDWFDRMVPYASNRLALMVHLGNPKHIFSLQDLGRSDVRVSMPDSRLEGIGRLVENVLEKAGGQALVNRVLVEKTKQSKTFITRMHHRQTLQRVIRRESDVGPVWLTEVKFQESLGAPVESVEISRELNDTSRLVAARLRNPPNPQAASDFLDFLEREGPEIYREYGFLPA